MNLQGVKGIEWTRVWGRSGYTWNPVAGCLHACTWRIGGASVGCYAKEVADRFRSERFFKDGFESHQFHERRLSDPIKLRTPSGIFLDSMSDLFGSWVPSDQIDQVFDVCRKAPWHVFQSLTKNAPRLQEFAGRFPSNLWVGASMPPSAFLGHDLSPRQQSAMLSRSLSVLSVLPVGVRWMSFEPLSFDASSFVKGSGLRWAVVGAASDGRRLFQPNPDHLVALLDALDSMDVPVFFKGNLRPSVDTLGIRWREEFPAQGETA